MPENKQEELKDKKEDETSTTSAPEEETNEDESKEESDKKDESEEESEEQQGIDYKAELARVEAERDNYKQGLLNEKDKKRDRSNQKDDENDEDEALTPSKVADIVRRENEKARMDQFRDTFEDALAGASGNASERALIKFHYENSLQKTGYSRKDVERDIEKAKLLANAAKIKVNFDEAKRKAQSEDTKNKKGKASGQKSDDDFDPSNLSDADKALLKRHGLTAADVKPRSY